jgi:hypothetical protein
MRQTGARQNIRKCRRKPTQFETALRSRLMRALVLSYCGAPSKVGCVALWNEPRRVPVLPEVVMNEKEGVMSDLYSDPNFRQNVYQNVQPAPLWVTLCVLGAIIALFVVMARFAG